MGTGGRDSLGGSGLLYSTLSTRTCAMSACGPTRKKAEEMIHRARVDGDSGGAGEFTSACNQALEPSTILSVGDIAVSHSVSCGRKLSEPCSRW